MFKLFKKNYYRIITLNCGVRSYYIVKAKNEMQAELKVRRKYNTFSQIISIEKAEENEIE